jgi:RNA polymerase subunit RPABC4/transcription elongation factor Spt4
MSGNQKNMKANNNKLKCPNCLSPVAENAETCPNCKVEFYNCSNCNALVLETDTICKNCNSKLYVGTNEDFVDRIPNKLFNFLVYLIFISLYFLMIFFLRNCA